MNNLLIILDIKACVITCNNLKSSQHSILSGCQLKLALKRVIYSHTSNKTLVIKHKKLNKSSYIVVLA